MDRTDPADATKSVLVVGITGGAGSAVSRAFRKHGWRIRALHRDPSRALQQTGDRDVIDWRAGDAASPDDVASAADGVDVIVHAVNPPAYRNWRELAIPMLASSIAAARQTGARILFPGNVYNFGPDAWPLLREDSPQHPTTRKGTLRAVTYPGAPEVGHAWAYLPDLGATFARVADLEQGLPDFERLHFGGHWLEPGIEMVESVRRVLGQPGLHVRRMPWWLMRLAAPAAPFLRELLEMRYLWYEAVRLDNSRLVALLGGEPHTPLDEAMRATLEALGCIESAVPTD